MPRMQLIACAMLVMSSGLTAQTVKPTFEVASVRTLPTTILHAD